MPIKDRVKKLLRQRAFFFKLLMSITGLICIPLIALQIYMIGRSTNEYKKSTQEMYLSVLQQYALNFSSQEQVLSKVAWRISMDEAVQKPLKHNATEYSWYLASESLNHYGKENLYVSYTGVYYTAKGYILADGIKNTLKDFSKRYSADAEQQEQLCAFFLNLSLPDYYATVDGGTLFSAFPVSLGSAGINDAVVFFAIDAHLLEKSYRNSVSPDTSLAVIDSQGNFLLQGASFVTDVSLNAVTTLLGKNTDIYTVTTENDIQLYKYQDPVSNFTFLLSVNRNEIQQKLIDFASGIRSTLYFALILLGVLLSITLYINYRPIHLLLERYTTSQADEEEHSELERLGSAFFALDERLSAQKSLLIDFLLGDLLFTTSANQELVQQYFPPGKYCSFVVISAKCPTVTTGQMAGLSERLIDVTNCYVHVTRVPYRPQLAIIMLSETKIDGIPLKDTVRRVLLEQLHEECPVAVGEVVEDIYALRTSYRSSLAPVAAVYCPTETQTHDVAFSKLLQAVLHPLYVGDDNEAIVRLGDIERFLFENLPNETHRKFYGYKLLSAFLSGVNSSDIKLSAQEADQLMSFTSTQHLLDLLKRSIHRICMQLVNAEKTVDLQLQGRLLRYVDANYLDSELCLTTAADYLDTSIYVVSRLFKEATGRGFKDYVTEKRLEYGHSLLCSTKQSIAEISAAAGFENANYFSTVFKMKYGLPPTRFRKNLIDNQQE